MFGAEERFFKRKILISNVKELQPGYGQGTLVLADSQAVIDECISRGIPVAGLEHYGITGLSCRQIVTDIDDIDEKDFEKIYRRCAGIPLTIAYTDRTVIREFSMEDLDGLFALYSEPHFTDFMEPLFDYEEEMEYEKNYIEYIYKLYGFGMWLIFDRHTGKLIGRAGIEVRESCDRPSQAELGFAIAPHLWRQGLAYEVCSKIVSIAKTDFSLTSLIARCDPANAASIGLLEKLGFLHAGYEPDGDLRYFREL